MVAHNSTMTETLQACVAKLTSLEQQREDQNKHLHELTAKMNAAEREVDILFKSANLTYADVLAMPGRLIRYKSKEHCIPVIEQRMLEIKSEPDEAAYVHMAEFTASGFGELLRGGYGFKGEEREQLSLAVMGVIVARDLFHDPKWNMLRLMWEC
jgi:hypothetical protein